MHSPHPQRKKSTIRKKIQFIACKVIKRHKFPLPVGLHSNTLLACLLLCCYRLNVMQLYFQQSSLLYELQPTVSIFMVLQLIVEAHMEGNGSSTAHLHLTILKLALSNPALKHTGIINLLCTQCQLVRSMTCKLASFHSTYIDRINQQIFHAILLRDSFKILSSVVRHTCPIAFCPIGWLLITKP